MQIEDHRGMANTAALVATTPFWHLKYCTKPHIKMHIVPSYKKNKAFCAFLYAEILTFPLKICL
ncbi:MAG: hypothetical protein EAY75_10765 [Bacteroidetes bacterium]|nr:MAG: hypothetical protein EAY75_10765 [Bacteroidota bacterium]